MTYRAHRVLAYLCFFAAVCAAVLVMVSVFERHMGAYIANTAVFLICSVLGLFNLRQSKE